MCVKFWCVFVISVLFPNYIELKANNDTRYISPRIMVTVPTTTERTVIAWTPGREVYREYIDGELTVFRVVNGREGSLGDVPYQIAFRKLVRKTDIYGTFCGGTLVTGTQIISAAHCFRRRSIWDSCCKHSGYADKKVLSKMYAVAATKYNFVYRDEHGEEQSQWRRIIRARYPQSFTFPRADIAVVTLAEPFEFNQYVSTVPYATKLIDYKGSCLVSGYGRTDGGSTSDILRLAQLRVLSNSACIKFHNHDMRKFVCSSDELSDIGKGDSGGPLICRGTGDPKEKDKGILVGVVCGKRLRGAGAGGSFFTRVSMYDSFLHSALSKGIKFKCSYLVGLSSIFIVFRF